MQGVLREWEVFFFSSGVVSGIVHYILLCVFILLYVLFYMYVPPQHKNKTQSMMYAKMNMMPNNNISHPLNHQVLPPKDQMKSRSLKQPTSAHKSSSSFK